ncbi:MAG: 30S ribosomal protein S7 [Coxiella sp. RIFCSPHIGHO2_12_FULL_44_14]|nr:MAG: 30S ribosomal protein S7 [Coxiella sp. RIFCSPHIGHO2_12_FULL_44_14]
MSRRKAAPKRTILPDPLYRSELLTKFINTVMRNGKKSVAEKIVYGALETVAKQAHGKAKQTKESEGDSGESGSGSGSPIARKSGDDSLRTVALNAFKQALENATPSVEVKSRRVGGSTYQVPSEIRVDRRRALAMRWLVEFANQRSEKTMKLRLAAEILEAMEGRGGAIKKREDMHRMAKANQAFAHYRW